MYVRTYVCIYVLCMHACMHVCMYICMCAHTPIIQAVTNVPRKTFHAHYWQLIEADARSEYCKCKVCEHCTNCK
jgi:hypothetical protein